MVALAGGMKDGVGRLMYLPSYPVRRMGILLVYNSCVCVYSYFLTNTNIKPLPILDFVRDVLICFSKIIVNTLFHLASCLPACVPACLPACLSACLPACLSACMHVCMRAS